MMTMIKTISGISIGMSNVSDYANQHKLLVSKIDLDIKNRIRVYSFLDALLKIENGRHL